MTTQTDRVLSPDERRIVGDAISSRAAPRTLVSLVRRRLRNRLNRALRDRNLPTKPLKTFGIDAEMIAEHLGPMPPGNQHRWHIDHLVPLRDFDLRDAEQVRMAFAPENLRWLSSRANHQRNKRPDETIRQPTLPEKLREAAKENEQILQHNRRALHYRARVQAARFAAQQIVPIIKGEPASGESDTCVTRAVARVPSVSDFHSREARVPLEQVAEQSLGHVRVQRTFSGSLPEAEPPKGDSPPEGDFRESPDPRPADAVLCPGCGRTYKASAHEEGCPKCGVRADGSATLGGTATRDSTRWGDLVFNPEQREAHGIPAFPGGPDSPIVRLPAPPRLDPTDDDEYMVRALARAYRDAARKLWGDGDWLFKGTRGSPRAWRGWKRLVAATKKLIEHDLSPIVWAYWSMQTWLTNKGGKLPKQPPPMTVVFSPDKIDRFRGWCRQETRGTVGGATFRPPSLVALAKVWSQMHQKMIEKDPDPNDTEAVQRIVTEYFPPGYYDEQMALARKEADDKQAMLRRAAQENVWIW